METTNELNSTSLKINKLLREPKEGDSNEAESAVIELANEQQWYDELMLHLKLMKNCLDLIQVGFDGRLVCFDTLIIFFCKVYDKTFPFRVVGIVASYELTTSFISLVVTFYSIIFTLYQKSSTTSNSSDDDNDAK
jgi:hypothetical protein